MGHPKINVNICTKRIIENDSENEEEEENNSIKKVYNETPLCYNKGYN